MLAIHLRCAKSGADSRTDLICLYDLAYKDFPVAMPHYPAHSSLHLITGVSRLGVVFMIHEVRIFCSFYATSFTHNFMMIGFCTVLLLNYSVEIQTSLPKYLILFHIYAHSFPQDAEGDQLADVHRLTRLLLVSLSSCRWHRHVDLASGSHCQSHLAQNIFSLGKTSQLFQHHLPQITFKDDT
jgi:hypothetical protein